jgi:lipopolysaccharide assembly outer membrane protein LptD (OstA)
MAGVFIIALREKGGSMRRIVLGIALMACLPVFAQDQPTAVPVHGFKVFRTSGGYRVSMDDGREVNVLASSIEAVNPVRVVRFKGDVEMKINGLELRADEVDYHWDTGEIEPLGNVHLKPIAP